MEIHLLYITIAILSAALGMVVGVLITMSALEQSGMIEIRGKK